MFGKEKYSRSAFQRLKNLFITPALQSLTYQIPEGIKAEVLRLDLIHPVVSGNKWFKLRVHLETIEHRGIKQFVTFGGAYSNHIAAAAFCAHEMNLKAVGIIRGEQPARLSPTLSDAQAWGMELFFVSREQYDEPGKKRLMDLIKQRYPGAWTIAEGGFDELGIEGAATLLESLPRPLPYTHILCAVGTSAMMSGLLRAVNSPIHITGISVLKNNFQLDTDVVKFMPAGYTQPPHEILHHYHFGGYAKKTPELISFMNELYEYEEIPTDFVYSAKLFYGFYDLVRKGYFPEGSKVLIIHCGGLQGNRSLAPGSLTFPSGH
ncbi:MAG TPA: pyridoxal-phosphate dependent enzyme [Parasegetibacter sp.]|jgi:1-aminocyclopropane-1-carboxylate deaminase